MNVKINFFVVYVVLITIAILFFLNILIYFINQTENNQRFEPQINELGDSFLQNNSFLLNMPANKSEEYVVHQIQLQNNIFNPKKNPLP